MEMRSLAAIGITLAVLSFAATLGFYLFGAYVILQVLELLKSLARH